MFDTFLFTYVLYCGGFVHFHIGIFARIGSNALLSWYLGSQMGLAGIGLALTLGTIFGQTGMFIGFAVALAVAYVLFMLFIALRSDEIKIITKDDGVLFIFPKRT